jgi:hypothetical protein
MATLPNRKQGFEMSKIENKPVSLKVTKSEEEWLSSVLGAEVTADIVAGRMSKDTLMLLTDKRREVLGELMTEVDQINSSLHEKLEKAIVAFNSATAAYVVSK